MLSVLDIQNLFMRPLFQLVGESGDPGLNVPPHVGMEKKCEPRGAKDHSKGQKAA